MLAFVLFVIAGNAMAADGLSIAKEALRDGLWEIARAHARTNDTEEAKLVVLESLAGEGKWDEIGELVNGDWKRENGVGFAYYRAVVRGDHAAADAILKAGGSSEGLVEVRLHEADLRAKAGDRKGADAIWREIAARTNVGERVLARVSANLMDVALLRKAHAAARTPALRRTVGLRLGVALLRTEKTAEEGGRLVRALAKDAPDAPGAREAFLAVADAELAAERWAKADAAFREAVETWPETARMSAVQEGRGLALQKLGKREEALEAFRAANELATDDGTRATTLLRVGDVLSELGRMDEAMARYREIVEKYRKTAVAERLKTVVLLRETESEGRRLYNDLRFADAQKMFRKVAEGDPSRRPRMEYLDLLCLYGQGRDDEAAAAAGRLASDSPDPAVRAAATLWLAKVLYNRREWKDAARLFASAADTLGDGEQAAEALLWASRASLADNDFNGAIRFSTRLSERHPDSVAKPAALLVQGEALIELARFEEAVLVFERVAVTDGVGPAVRYRSRILRADALYAMGADNPARYTAALDAYRALRTGSALPSGAPIVLDFKIARTLDRLKRTDEALDQYYAHVVLAYREGRLRGERFDDETRAAFSRAAFRLADEYESRGRDRQAIGVLELVAESDVPASDEARKRIGRISRKGGFL